MEITFQQSLTADNSTSSYYNQWRRAVMFYVREQMRAENALKLKRFNQYYDFCFTFYSAQYNFEFMQQDLHL